MAISKRLRFEILRRDGFKCRYCGATAQESELTVDHVYPVALGGEDKPGNLACACIPCNSGKASTRPDEVSVSDVEEDAFRWACAVELAASQRRSGRAERDCYLDDFKEAWDKWTYGDEGLPVPIEEDWTQSIGEFLEQGLDVRDLLEFLNASMGRAYVEPADTWKYFCGMCWRTIESQNEEARRLLEMGAV